MMVDILDNMKEMTMGYSDLTKKILGDKAVVANRVFVIMMQWGNYIKGKINNFYRCLLKLHFILRLIL